MRHNRESYERAPLPGAGYLEDYTVPFLVAAGVLCFVTLFAIWTIWVSSRCSVPRCAAGATR